MRTIRTIWIIRAVALTGAMLVAGWAWSARSTFGDLTLPVAVVATGMTDDVAAPGAGAARTGSSANAPASGDAARVGSVRGGASVARQPAEPGVILNDTTDGTGGGGTRADCNSNGISDDLDIAGGTSQDCNATGVPDECEVGHTSGDCNENGVPDECESSADCNANGIADLCDIYVGTSQDSNADGVPDECQAPPDCNANNTPDDQDISNGYSQDCDGNSIPDECDLAAGTRQDCQPNGTPDECENPPDHNCCTMGHGPGCNDPQIQACMCALDPFCCEGDWDFYCKGNVEQWGCGSCRGNRDCNANGTLDECDILHGGAADCQPNGIPDVCELNGLADYPGLAHRFSFTAGPEDTVTGASGVFYGDAHIAGGALVLDGDGDYAALPLAATLSTLTDVTLEAWVSWGGGEDWQRIFDIGTDDTNYMFLTPRGGYSSVLRFAIKLPSTGEEILDGTTAFPTGVLTHVAVTVGADGHARLYVNGALDNEAEGFTIRPRDLGPVVHSHLGKSFFDDPYLNGSIAEFRVYRTVLTGAQIAAHAAAGPDAAIGTAADCNGNGTPDECDVGYTSGDCNHDGIPDECQPPDDCNGNNIADLCDIYVGTSLDCQPNGTPDECELGGIVYPVPADLAEMNAAEWAGWSDEGTITVTDDDVQFTEGNSALRVVTDGCADNAVWYPAGRTADWNLSSVQSIHVWFYAENPNDPDFQNYSPRIRLGCANGEIEWIPNEEMLNQALGQWVEFVVPIAGDSTWTRNDYGAPALANVRFVQINADTWGCGFTLWVDGLRFDPPPQISPGDCNGNGIPDSCDMLVSGALYGIDPYGAALYTVDPVAAQTTWVANLPVLSGARALTFGPGLGGTLYAVVDANSTGTQLARIDPQNVTVNLVAPLDGPEDIVFGPSGQLYGIRYDATIVRIDPATGALTPTGIAGTAGSSNGPHTLAFRPGTRSLYHAFSYGYCGGLEVIDLGTGVTTEIVAGSKWYQALAYDSVGHRLLGSAWDEFVAIDPTTGAETVLGYLNPELDGLAYNLEVQDCNGNGTLDTCDVSGGASQDANGNGTPDECDFSLDCNQNGSPDYQDVQWGGSSDCNGNGVPDECETEDRHGLAAAYFDNPDFSGTLRGRLDPNISFDWGDTNPLPEFDDAFSVRWTGFIQTPDAAGEYTFYANTDDGVRLWINNQLVIDQWVVQDVHESSGSIRLEANRAYPMVMEYFNDGGPAVAQLRWEVPGIARAGTVIPTDRFFPGRDCNFNSRLDACDMAAGTTPDCNHNGIPDECDMAGVGPLYGIDYDATGLFVVDPATLQITPAATLTSLETAHGLTFGPGPNGMLYALVNANSGGLYLARIDPPTGDYYLVGQLDSNIEDIAFGPLGKLYGVRSYWSSVPAEIVTIDPSDAFISPTGLSATAGWGDTPATIAARPGTSLLYRVYSPSNFLRFLEVIDLHTGARTTLSEDMQWYESIVYDPTGMRLLGYMWGELYAIDVATGEQTYLGSLGDRGLEGLAYGVAMQDCNHNGVFDACDITDGWSVDCNGNQAPDECELGPADVAVGELTDAERPAAPAYVDLTAARIVQHGRSATFILETRGTIPTTLPQPTDKLTYLWLIDVDRDPGTGQNHGEVGSEFNVRAVIGQNDGGAFVDVTGALPGGGYGTLVINGNRLELTLRLDQIASPAQINWRSDAFGYVTGLGNINNGGETAVASGTFSTLAADCNSNGTLDDCDIAQGTSRDTNQDGVPDECEVAADCNHNGVEDAEDIRGGTSGDCNTNGIPDECEADCNVNGFPDDCDIAQGTSGDCNTNGIPDECEVDCNTNGTPDDCDIRDGSSLDCQPNGTPDECELGALAVPALFPASCNLRLQNINSGFPQGEVVLGGVPFSIPTGGNNIWHSYYASGANPRVLDINVDIWRAREVHTLINTYWGLNGPSSYAALDFYGSDGAHYTKNLVGNVDIRDYNQGGYTNSINGTTSTTVVQISGHRLDKQRIVLPSEFRTQRLIRIRLSDLGTDGAQRVFLSGVTVVNTDGQDCNLNGIPDACDLTGGTSRDCNANTLPDECDIAAGSSTDCDANGTPDSCDMTGPGLLYVLNEWGELSTLDPQTGQVTAIATLSPSTGTTYGLAFAPGAGGQLYAVVEADSTLQLIALDPQTGGWTSRGTLNDAIADIAFAADGQLYGVVGESGASPGAIVTLNTANATITPTGISGSGGPYQAMAIKPGTRLVYHTSDADENGASQLEVIDLATGQVTPIGAELQNNYLGLVYDPATNLLVAAYTFWGYPFWTIDPVTGEETNISDKVRAMGVLYSGLSFGTMVYDCNHNGTLDVCERDCNGNSIPDDCDIAGGTSTDCEPNGFPDECDVAAQNPPAADLTELNAASWTSWAQDGTVTLTDDTAFKHDGLGALRMDATGGGDNYVRFPGDHAAHWSLTGVQTLRVWFYAINTNYGFQSNSPRFRLGSARGYYQWTPTSDVLGQAVGKWVQFQVPIAGNSTWQRSTSGTPSLSAIEYVEIHADTWGYGFTLWIDGVNFQPNAGAYSADCNADGVPDTCDIAAGTSLDGNANGIPDECEIDLELTTCGAPGSIDAGQSLSVGWTVTNIGGLAANGTWTDKVYLSSDDVVGNDTELGSFPHAGPLNPTQSYAPAQSVALAGDLAGDYWVILRTDVGGTVNELREDNNARVCGPLSIRDTLPPQTTITDGPPNNSNVAAAQVSFTWTGSDNHTPAAGLVFAYCVAPVSTGCDPRGGPFAADTSAVLTGLTQENSPYVFKVVARDAAGNVGLNPAQRTFTVDWTGVTVLSHSPNGAGHENVCALQVTFNELPYHLETSDLALTGPAGPITITGVQRQGSTFTFAFNFACQSADGVYEFTLGPDITDAVGNPMAAPYTGSFSISMPDLAPTALDIPSNGVSGTAVAIEWTVENHGTIPAVGSWTDAVYLSTDAVLGGDTLLGEFSFSGPLNVGQSYHRVQNAPLPALLQGDFRIIVVSDARGNIVEHQEGADNIRVSATAIHLTPLPYPDLQVTAVNGPASVWTGQQVTLCWTVANSGSAATGATGWVEEVFLSFDTQLDSSDSFLGNFDHLSSLNAGGDSYQQCQAVTIPNNALGCFYFLVRVDALNQVFEYRPDLNAETNNDGHTAACADSTLPPPPDLQVTRVVAPATGWSGQNIAVTWDVSNLGVSPTGASYWQDSVYISADQTLDSTDARIATVGHNGALAPSGLYTATTSCALPRWVEGPFYVFVLTDSANHVAEQGYEGNNAGYDENTVLTISLTPPPDLEVTALDVTGPTADLKATVAWTVTNRGASPTETGGWYDGIYLSTDASFETTADNVKLGEWQRHNGGLAPDASYDKSVTVALPTCLDGTFYLFVVTDAGDQVEEFFPDYEANNDDVYKALTIATLEPDLALSNVHASTNGYSGQPITVSWEVNNAGAAATGTTAFVDRVFLSTDTTLDPAHDTLLGTFPHETSVATSNGYTESRNVTLPAGISGDYFVFVFTDAQQALVECGATANNVGYDALGIHVVFTEADLVVAMNDAPTNGFSGELLEVSWTVTNAGTRATDATGWVDAVYLLPGGAPLATFAHTGALAAGASYTRTEQVQMPPALTGARTLRVCTDAYNVAFEPQAENNNCASFVVNFAATEPDLAVTNVTAPDAGQSGTVITVQWTVDNVGERGTTQSAWLDKIYLSDDTTFSTDDLLLGVAPHTGAVAVGAPYTTSKMVTLESSGAGPHYVLVRTDTDNAVYELNREANNTGFDPTPIQVTCNDPDLQVLTTTGPSAGNAGLPLELSWTVTNSGVRATGVATWVDGVYLSTDPNWDPATDVLLGEFSHNAVLPVGGTYSRTATVTLPNGISGVHYLFAVADSRNAVGECSNEANNASAPPVMVAVGLTLADLQVDAVTATSNGYAGQETAVAWTVRNAGSSATPSNTWRDGVYLSLDAYVDPATDPFLGTVTHTNPLAAGGTYSASAALTIPAATPAGDYYVLVWTDSAGDVYEHNAETNNTRVSPALIHVAEPLEADLVVTSIVPPLTAAPAQMATFTWTVTNTGVNAAVGSWYDSIYLSADATWDLGDALVAKVRHDGTIAANGGAYTATATKLVPGVVPEPHYVIVRCDINNQIPEGEAGEENNIGVSSTTTDIQIIELTLGVPFAATLSGSGVANYYQVTVPADETLRVTLDAAATLGANELYIRYGAIPDRGHYDAAYDNPFVPDQQVTIATTAAGTYYILVYGTNVVSPPAPYTILAESLPFGINAVVPNTATNTAAVTLKITGARFEPETEFSLIAPDDVEIMAQALYAQDQSVAFATFDLHDVAVGLADVKAVNPDAQQAFAIEAFDIVSSGGAHLTGQIIAPSRVRAGRSFPVRIEYSNIGNADMPAPLLELSSSEPAPMSFSADGPFDRIGGIRFLALNPDGPAGILPPGAFGVLNVHIFIPDTGNWAHRYLNLGLRWWTGDGLVDWEAEAALVRPAGVLDGHWEAVWNRLVNHVGPTWSDFERALAVTATRLWQGGERIYDVQELLRRELDLAWDEYPSWISGVLIDDASGAPLAGERIVAASSNGEVIVLTESDAGGGFELKVPAGHFELSSPAYYFDPFVFVDPTPDHDVRDVVLRAIPKPLVDGPPPPPEPREIPDAGPVLGRDAAGQVHLVWNRGPDLWHARLAGTDWDITGPVGTASGDDPRIAAGPPSAGEHAVTVVWQQGAQNEAELRYAVGKPQEAPGTGFQWADPVNLTNDTVADWFPAVLVTPAGEMLAVWIKKDAAAVDDTDLYYQIVPIAARTWSDPAPGVKLALDLAQPDAIPIEIRDVAVPDSYGRESAPLRGSDSQCITAQIRAETTLKAPPGCEGPWGFYLSGQYCGASVKCDWSGSMSAGLGFLMGPNSAQGSGSGTATYTVKKDEKKCDWVLKGASGNLTASGNFKIPMGPIPNPLQALGIPPPFIPCSKWGWLISGSLSGGVTYNAGTDLTQMPDKGTIRIEIGGGPYGEINLGEVIQIITLKAQISGQLSVYIKVSLPLQFDIGGCGTITVEGQAGILRASWQGKWCAGTDTREELMLRDYSPRAYVARNSHTLQDGGSYTDALVVEIDPLVGTGNVYPGQTVLADVTGDLTNDGAPAVARAPSGEMLAVWTKDSATPQTALGSAVVAAHYTAGHWSTPVELMNAHDFNRNPQVVFDSAGNALAVWTTASANGYDLNSAAGDILRAAADSDVVYARRVAGVWSAPTPVATLPGTDDKVALAADDAGHLVAVWLHSTTNQPQTTVYAAFWNPDAQAWEAPTPIASQLAAAAPSVAFAGTTPVVVWAADADGNGDTPEDQTLYSSTFSGTSWSTPAALLKARSDFASAVARETQSPNKSLLPTIPKECCACEKDEECNDGKFCNGKERCLPQDEYSDEHGCIPAMPPWVCDPIDACDEDADQCVQCMTDAHCNDQKDCTVDKCVNHKCQHDAQNSICDDGQFCNGREKCVPTNPSGGSSGCIPGKPPCPPATTCNEEMDECSCRTDADCDDGHPCTDDICSGGSCMHVANDEICPDDGDVCNGPERCDEYDGCVSGPALDCDDGNECTSDSCDSGGGCMHDPVHCGTSNACVIYTCVPSSRGGGGCKMTRTNCDDGNSCTADSCDPASGCKHSALDCKPDPETITSGDPNEKIGPTSYGEEGWVGGTQELLYTIRFENVPDASAPAQVVTVTDQLSSNLDWRTFRVRDLGFGATQVSAPGNSGFLQTDVDLRSALGLIVRVHAGINVQTGLAQWTLTALDPATGELPTNADAGFLPPNNANHDGEGYVTFTVRAKSTAPTGTVLTNGATIVFDVNEPIDTNVVSNTLDADPPASAVAALPAQVEGPEIPLQWSGVDAEGGSGLASFTVYVSVDGGTFLPFLSNTTETAATYTGQAGHTYAFYSLGRDHAGNVEAVPAQPDATTVIPVALAVAEITVNGGLTQRSNVADLQLHFSTGTNLAELIADGTVVQAVTLWHRGVGARPAAGRGTAAQVISPSTTASVSGTVGGVRPDALVSAPGKLDGFEDIPTAVDGQQVPLGVERYSWDPKTAILTIDLTVDGPGGSARTLLSNDNYELRLATNLIRSAWGNPLVDNDGTPDGIYRFGTAAEQRLYRLAGDGNGDRTVNLLDLQLVRSAWLMVPGVPGYDPNADMNSDGRVNLLDLQLIRSSWLTKLGF
jgi:hypothetical protein